MPDYGDKQKQRRKAIGENSRLTRCTCGHKVYDFEAHCPICETDNPLYLALTPAAPSQPLTRET